MFVAERTMVGNLFPGGIVTGPWAHHSRVLEFGWSAGQWNLVPVATYSLGHHYAIASTYPTNSAGGVDPDWGPGGRVWATGDALHYDYAQDSSTTAPHTPQFSDYIYGIQGLPATGGSVINSILIDTGNSVAAHNKTLIGDVKIPCPECTSPPVIAGPQNTCVSPSHYTISNAQNNVSYTWTVHGGTASATTGSAIDVNWSNTGPYSIVVTTSGPGGCGPVRTAFTVTACPVNSCSYCRDFDTNATLPRPPVSLSGGLEDVKPTVTSNMPGVTSITETVLSASVAYSSPACGVSGPVGAYIPQASQSSPAASNSPVVPISNGNQVIWQSFSGVNFSGGVSTPFHLQLPPPPVLPQPCSANFSFCMSFSLADERCRNCAVIKCFGPFIYGRPISTPETGSVPQPAEQLKPTKKKKP